MNSNRDQFLEAAGLRVRFVWHGDRFAHEIWLFEQGRWQRALASMEGSPEDSWPVSPPFQSLEIEQRGGHAVALLVGMAGTSHWSASARIDPQAACVHFDVAARVRAGEAGPLGSAYRRDVALLELQGANDSALVEREGDAVRVAVATSTDTVARTIRWAYRVCRSA